MNKFNNYLITKYRKVYVMTNDMYKFSWNEKEGHAICAINAPNGHRYIGEAWCNSIDHDMMNEATGCNIAQMRATIKMYQGWRNEYKIRLDALNEVYYCMKHSTHFNPKSYENRMLQRKIKAQQENISTLNEYINDLRKDIKSYIDEKDMFYKRIRNNREHKTNQAKTN